MREDSTLIASPSVRRPMNRVAEHLAEHDGAPASGEGRSPCVSSGHSMFDPRWGDEPRDINNDRRDRDSQDRDEHDGPPDLGRGPSSRDEAETDPRHREDERSPDRGSDPRDRDPRDMFMRDLNLPRGREREIVYDARDRQYTLRG